MTRRERGAALAMTLVLLGGLGVLALSAASAAVSALALAGRQQSALQAFEAAEAGVAQALELAATSRGAARLAQTPYPDEAGATASFAARIERIDLPGTLPPGFSIGEHAGAFGAQHYVVVADGRAIRGARVRIEQGFYLVTPGAGP